MRLPIILAYVTRIVAFGNGEVFLIDCIEYLWTRDDAHRWMTPRSKSFHHCHEIIRIRSNDLVTPELFVFRTIFFQMAYDRINTQTIRLGHDLRVDLTDGTNHRTSGFDGKITFVNLFPKPRGSALVDFESRK